MGMLHETRILVCVAAATAILACSGNRPAPAPPVSPFRDIVRAHYDQACRDGRRVVAPVQASELFDTVGLGTLVRQGFGGAPVDRDASIDFVSRYDRSGALRAFGLWSFTSDSATAGAMVAEMRERALPLERLLEPAGFRTHMEFFPRLTLSVGAPIICEPHIVHAEGARPTGLPDTVRLFGGRSSIRSGNDSTAQVRIHLDARGEVVSVERRAGGLEAFAEAERTVRGLRYDPALLNGEPVEGQTTQTLAFTSSAPPTPAEADSAFLAQTGFDRRSQAFEPLLHARVSDPGPTAVPELLRSVPDVRVEGVGEATRVFVGDVGCPVSVRLNGASSGAEGASDRRFDIAGASAAFVNGVELYGPQSSVVADGEACGTLLLWSRELSGVVYQPLLGHVEGRVVGMAPGGGTTDVMIDPVGRTAFLRRSGQFGVYGLLPGDYVATVRRGGEPVGSGTFRVTAGATVEVRIEVGRSR